MQLFSVVFALCLAHSAWNPVVGLASRGHAEITRKSQVDHHEVDTQQRLSTATAQDEVEDESEYDDENDEQDEENSHVSNGSSIATPTLPPVSLILSDASLTAKHINEKAAMLEARILKEQEEGQAKMAKRKSALEHRLKVQEDGTKQVNATNNQILAESDRLEENNQALRKQAKEVKSGNRLMASELRALDARLAAAQTFISHALKSIDDSQDKALGVLSAKESDTDDQDEDDNENHDAGDDPAHSGTSLLAITERHSEDSFAPDQNQDTGGLLTVLAQGVTSMSAQQRASDKKLEELFAAKFEAGSHERSELLSDEKDEEQDRESLTSLQKELRTALGHLEETQDHSQKNLRALGLFLQRLGHLALSPEKDVLHLMESLPSAPEEKH